MRKHPRVCDLPGGIPVHWWLYLTRQYQDGLFGRDAGFDFHVLTQFQFDASPPQRWYTREIKSWSGITLDLNTKRNVIRINLSGVMLLQIPESIGDLQSLVLLYMPNNKLVTLPESIGNLKSLRHLDISDNALTTLPETIVNLNSLIRLEMNRNKLTTLPESISELVSLTYISISENPVSSTKDKQNEIIRRFARLRLYIDID